MTSDINEKNRVVLLSMDMIRGEANPSEGDPPDGGGAPDPGDGGTPDPEPTWRDSVSEDLRSHVESYETVDDLIKAHIDIQGKVPDIPENPEDYGYEFDAENAPVSEAEFKQLSKFLHSLSLTKNQFEKSMDAILTGRAQYDQVKEKMAKDRREAARENLQEIHGEETENVINASKDFIRKYADSEFVTYLNESDLGNDPRMIQFIHKISKAVSEDALEEGDYKPKSKVKRTEGGTPVLDFPSMNKE